MNGAIFLELLQKIVLLDFDGEIANEDRALVNLIGFEILAISWIGPNSKG
jgi:hypothetical protein